MKLLLLILMLVSVNSVAEEKIKPQQTDYTDIYTICIKGYLFVVYSRAGGVAQIFKKRA